jgi:hypothetical protein
MIKFFFFLFVASYAESRLSQGNLNQPDVAFCFCRQLYPNYKVRIGCSDTPSSPRLYFFKPMFFDIYWVEIIITDASHTLKEPHHFN